MDTQSRLNHKTSSFTRPLRLVARVLAVSLAGGSLLLPGVPAQAQLGPLHAHVVFGEATTDCHTGTTSSEGAPGEVGVIFCLFETNILGSEVPVDTSGGKVLWSTTGVGTFVGGSVESDTDATGVARARITSASLGEQRVSACYDGDANGLCDGTATRGTATREWTVPILRLRFTPVPMPCTAGSIMTETVVGDDREFVACMLTQEGDPVSGGAVTPTIQSGPGSVSPPSASTDGSGRATFTIASEVVGTTVVTATGSTGGDTPVPSDSTLTNTWNEGPPDHLHLAFAPPDASSHVCSEGPDTDSQNAGRENPFVACVQDEFDNPVPDVVVTPTVVSGPGEIRPATATTDADGIADFAAFSTRTGESSISATAGSPVITATAVIVKTWTAARLVRLTLAFTPADATCASPSSETSAVDNPNEFVACAFDEFGNAVTGAAVTPSVSSGPGTVSPITRNTDSSGRALFTLNSTQTGVSVVEAEARAATVTVDSESTLTHTWTAGPLDHVHLAFTPATPNADPCSAGPTSDSTRVNLTNEFVACAQDRFHNAVEGARVIPSLRSGPAVTFGPTEASSDASGRATFTMLATRTGDSVVSAEATSEAVSAGSNSITNSWTPEAIDTLLLAFDPPDAECTSPKTRSSEVANPSDFVACALDANGNGVGGVVVTAEVSSGPGAVSPMTATTAASGRASFSVSSTEVGESVITASADGESSEGPITQTWTPGAVAGISLEPVSATVAAGVHHLLTATLVDAFGNDSPESGRPIAWRKVSGVGDFTFRGFDTDAGGQATATFRSEETGSSLLQTCIDDGGLPLPNSDMLCDPTFEDTDDASIDWVAAAANHIHLAFLPDDPSPGDPCAAGPFTDETTVDSEMDFVACVVDEFDNVVPSARVTPSASGIPVTFTPPAKTTGSDGRAEFAVSSTEPGDAVITAAATASPVVMSTQPITATFTPGAIASIGLEPPSATAAAGQGISLTATALDQYENEVPGVAIALAATDISGPNASQPQESASPQTTNAGGEAYFRVTSTNKGGSTVTASSGGKSDTSRVSWTAAAFHHVHLSHVPPPAVHECADSPRTKSSSVDSPVTVLVCAQDVHNNPMGAGVQVTPFQASGAPVLTFTPESGLTDASGRATFTAGATRTGSNEITASGTDGSTTDVADETLNVVWTAGAADHLHLAFDPPVSTEEDCSAGPVTGAAQVDDSAMGGLEFLACAHDRHGNLVPGARVTPTVQSGSPATFSPSSASTGLDGRASFRVTSTDVGDSVISVLTPPGAIVRNTITATWTPGDFDHAHVKFTSDCENGPDEASPVVGNRQIVFFCLHDRFDNGTPGPSEARVHWQKESGVGSFESEENTVDALGFARATVTSTAAGDHAIRAFWDLDGGGLPFLDGRVSAHWQAGAAAVVTMTPESRSTPASDTPVQSFSVSVTDIFGNLKSGASVSFTASAIVGPNAGQPSPSFETKVTGPDGKATFTLGSKNVGTSTVKADIGTGTQPTDTSQSIWTVASPPTIILVPSSANAEAGQGVDLTAVIVDRFSNAVTGADVLFDASAIAGPNPSQPSTSPTTRRTDADGEAGFRVTSTNAGSSVVTARIASSPSISDSSNVDWDAGAPTRLILDPPSAQVTAGESVPLTATVRDSFENLIAGVVVDLHAGSIAGPGAAQPSQSSPTSTTNSQGEAYFMVTSTNSGASPLTATADGLTDSSRVTWTAGAFHHLHLAFSPPTPGAHDCSLGPFDDLTEAGVANPFVGCAQDEFDNPVAAVPVTPTVSSGPGSISPASTMTDSSGRATFSISSEVAATSVITATGGNPIPSSNELTDRRRSGDAEDLTLEPESADRTTGEAVMLTATARDGFGNPVAGLEIALAASAISGPNAAQPSKNPSTASTNSDGEAYFTVTSTNSGVSPLTATSPGLTDSSRVTWTAGALHHLHLALAPPNSDSHTCSVGPLSTLSSTLNSVAFVACAQDEFNNPLSGVAVTPTVISGPGTVSPASATTASNGRAAFTASSTEGGTSRIRAAARAGGVLIASSVETLEIDWKACSPLVSSFNPYPGFTGGIFVASGDVDGDGCDEIITAPDEGGGPHVVVADEAGAVLPGGSFDAYGRSFRGGVRVAAGDLDGDGDAEIVTIPGPGGRPHARIWDFDGSRFVPIGSFFAYPEAFRGGSFAAVGDVIAGAAGEIIFGPDETSVPQVNVFHGTSEALLESFFAYGASFRGGVRVAAGNFDSDGLDELVTAPGPGGSPHIRVWDRVGSDFAEKYGFFAYDRAYSRGVFVGAGDTHPTDPGDELLTGPGTSTHVIVFAGESSSRLASFFAYEKSFRGGVRVAAGDGDFDGDGEVVTGPGPGRATTVKKFE